MDLFSNQLENQMPITQGAVWLCGYALPIADLICQQLSEHFKHFPPQAMMTPMGYQMSVATTSMGAVGWVSSKVGYGYADVNPVNQQPWPAIPPNMVKLAQDAALVAGYANFEPDCCLINVYTIGSKMGLHQDKDERDFNQPVVSVSLGVPATFIMGGAKRSEKTTKILLCHGDVIVFGGGARCFYHGVLAIKQDNHPLLGKQRINLTFRKAR